MNKTLRIATLASYFTASALAAQSPPPTISHPIKFGAEQQFTYEISSDPYDFSEFHRTAEARAGQSWGKIYVQNGRIELWGVLNDSHFLYDNDLVNGTGDRLNLHMGNDRIELLNVPYVPPRESERTPALKRQIEEGKRGSTTSQERELYDGLESLQQSMRRLDQAYINGWSVNLGSPNFFEAKTPSELTLKERLSRLFFSYTQNLNIKEAITLAQQSRKRPSDQELKESLDSFLE